MNPLSPSPRPLDVLLPALAVAALAAAVVLQGSPWVLGLLAPPALFWAPGLGLARALARREGSQPGGLQVHVDGAWMGVLGAVIGVSVSRETGLGSPVLVVMALGVAGWGLDLLLAWRPSLAPGGWANKGPLPSPPPHPGRRLGLAVLAVMLGGGAWIHQDGLRRELEDYWWHPGAEVETWRPVRVQVPGFEPVGWPEAGAREASVEAGTLEIHVLEAGRLGVLARGPVGLGLMVSQGARRERARVEADPVVDPEEGPVPRYLDRGTAAVFLDLEPGTATMALDQPATVFLLPTPDATWSLHAAGRARYVHYYQILNIVENQRWAWQVQSTLRGTVSQPPLWSYVLALPVSVGGTGLPVAGGLLVWVIFLCGLSGLRVLEVWGPSSPMVAWTLPGAASLVHLRILVEPGSINFPDSLYGAALVAGFTALGTRATFRYAAMVTAAGLLRYPGSVLLLAAGMLESPHRKRTVTVAALVFAALVGILALVGAATGNLGAWAETVAFEIGPEHWHGDGRPWVLASRIPGFLWEWLTLAGLAPILAFSCPRGPIPRLAALVVAYGLFLGTIDHRPSHYFIPLVHLSCALAGAALAYPRGLARPVLAWACAASLWIILLLGGQG